MLTGLDQKLIRTITASALAGALLLLCLGFLGARAVFADGPVDIVIDELPPGKVLTITFQVIISDTLLSQGTSAITNQAIISASNLTGSILTDDPDTITPNDPTVTPLDVADLGIVKRFEPNQVGPGQPVTYTLIVTNYGPLSVTAGSLVSDTLPDGLTFGGVAPSAGGSANNPSGNLVLWTLPGLNPGQDTVLSITATVNADTAAQTLVNTAVISSAPSDDGFLLNNSAQVTLTVNGADLALSKMVDNPMPAEDGPVVYTVTLTNNGPDASNGIEVSETLPLALAVSGSAPSQGSFDAAAGRWIVGSLNPTESARLILTATVQSGAAGQTLTNTVAISQASTADSIILNNVARAAITVTTSGSALYIPVIVK